MQWEWSCYKPLWTLIEPFSLFYVLGTVLQDFAWCSECGKVQNFGTSLSTRRKCFRVPMFFFCPRTIRRIVRSASRVIVSHADGLLATLIHGLHSSTIYPCHTFDAGFANFSRLIHDFSKSIFFSTFCVSLMVNRSPNQCFMTDSHTSCCLQNSFFGGIWQAGYCLKGIESLICW